MLPWEGGYVQETLLKNVLHHSLSTNSHWFPLFSCGRLILEAIDDWRGGARLFGGVAETGDLCGGSGGKGRFRGGKEWCMKGKRSGLSTRQSKNGCSVVTHIRKGA